MAKLTREEIIKRHSDLKRSYCYEMRRKDILEDTIARWEGSKDPNRQKHIDSLQRQLDETIIYMAEMLDEINNVETEMKRRLIKFEPLFKKI